MIVFFMTTWLVYEAVLRLITPEIVDGRIMFWVSLVGIGMNTVLIVVLEHGSEECSHGHNHGHSHGHSHSHSHGHSHGHGKPKAKAAECKHEHGHGHEHGKPASDVCGHEHGHGHGHGQKSGQTHEHEHGRSEAHHHNEGHEHGHSHERADADCRGHGSGGDVEAVDCGNGCSHAEPKASSKEEKSIAVRAAIIHVIGDILQSIGVCVSAAIIWGLSDRWLDSNGVSYWYRADPVCTLVFSMLVMMSSSGTLKEGLHVLMSGVPQDVDASDVQRQLESIPTVIQVHDLHVWILAGDKRNMWAHLLVTPGADSTSVLHQAQRIAASVDCHHSCFQVEDSGDYDPSIEGDGCYQPMQVPI